MKRFALAVLAALSLTVATPANAAAVGRVIEGSLVTVQPDPGGGYNFVFYVYYLNMGGSCGPFYPTGVIVHSATSGTLLPGTLARAAAYVAYGNDHVNGLTCASNTMQLLTPVDLITYITL